MWQLRTSNAISIIGHQIYGATSGGVATNYEVRTNWWLFFWFWSRDSGLLFSRCESWPAKCVLRVHSPAIISIKKAFKLFSIKIFDLRSGSEIIVAICMRAGPKRTWDSIRRNISQLRADCRFQERGEELAAVAGAVAVASGSGLVIVPRVIMKQNLPNRRRDFSQDTTHAATTTAMCPLSVNCRRPCMHRIISSGRLNASSGPCLGPPPAPSQSPSHPGEVRSINNFN